MSNLLNRRSHKIILLLVDLGLIYFSYILAFFIRFQEFPERNWGSFLSLTPWILLISLFFLSVYDLYALNRKSKWDIIRNVLVATTFMMILTMSASFLFREFALPRTVIFISHTLVIGLLIIWKFLFIKLNQDNQSGIGLLIGDNQEIEKIINQMKHPFGKGKKIRHIHANTPIERIIDFIVKTDYVIIGSTVSSEKKSDIIYHSIKNGKIVYVVPELYDLLLSKSIITSLDDTMVMAVKPFGLSLDQQVVKRIYDIIVSTLALIVLSPIFIIVSILIKLDDPKGKVFYKQTRIGKYNKEFTIIKFRSMIEGAEEMTGPTLAKENDPRITRIGHFIRKTRIDELPQLINVLKGDMSIVGPRPERGIFVKKYSKNHPSYRYRNTVKPGITGYAQIMGKYTTDVEDKLRFDLYYIRNYSFWLDLIIQLRTIIVLLDKKKAEGTSIPKVEQEKRTKSHIKFFLGDKIKKGTY